MNTGKMPQGMTAVSPMLTVKDIDAAMAFYQKAFGFSVKAQMPGPDGKTMHGEMQHGGCTLMLGAEMPGCPSKQPAMSETPGLTLYLYVENVDEFFAHAKESGATVKQEPTDMFWGDRICALQCPNGYHWSFGTFKTEVSAADMKKAMEAMAGAKA